MTINYKRAYYCLLMLLVAGSLSARIFKVATITPENSPWTATLRKFGQEMAEKTDKRFRLKVYAGGIAGEETDVLRKIKIGQLDGALLSALGIGKIIPSSLVMSLPFLIENNEQMEKVMTMAPDLFNEEGLEHGYQVLGWAFSGWVHLFSKRPVQRVEDLADMRMAVSPSQNLMVSAWQAFGVDVKILAFLDTPTGLQNGLVDIFYNSPAGAAAYQWFAFAKNMTEIPLSPLIGALVIDKRRWKTLTPADQQLIISELLIVGQQFQQQSLGLDERAKQVMLENGLKITAINDSEHQRWKQRFITNGYPFIVGDGKSVSTDTYQKITNLLGK